MTQMLVPEFSMEVAFNEAFSRLAEAAALEASWSRNAVQPYASLFMGTINYLDRNGAMSNKQLDELKSLLKIAFQKFENEKDFQTLAATLSKRLG
jgi:hypothetical protein